ncbi:cation:proton antiporter subunit C [Salinisphaera sp. Q1T1-3]|uniref:cation:proton antiporter subunit C n=1 Tax=Salinisphaera sp. Q1T1-3 TaxID=2321229 RepID=UPI000E750E8A|nr:cation:proton antiporter subunit C [Salinisphaera sp. Q1T1-3]RJS93124.1 Na+/H+ antiporter subunit C [Salinisphaera sp. Q1T1-3]
MMDFFNDTVAGLFNYWIVFGLMMIGFYTVIAHDNLVKKLIGLNVFQTSVFILYISMGDIRGATAPILIDGQAIYAHPLPQVLILTAIVVGVSTTALGLALIVRIHEAYGAIEEDDVLAADFATQDAEDATEQARSAQARATEPHAPADADDGAEREESRPS